MYEYTQDGIRFQCDISPSISFKQFCSYENDTFCDSLK
jgi:hypothetical protein